ncbi:hypothetical protein DFH27DRAFT_482662 [Peziza echinospora]|nr:hypothetical protein DFH27DRAFT_482662 [Peziza echinospora]
MSVILGHDWVVAYLCESESVKNEVKDSFGRTPLNWAACMGWEAIVWYLLSSRLIKVSIDSTDILGRSALHNAVA